MSAMPNTANATSAHHGADAGAPPARTNHALHRQHERIDATAKETRDSIERIDASRANGPVERADHGHDDARVKSPTRTPATTVT